MIRNKSLGFPISASLILLSLLLSGCNSESNPTGPENTDTGLLVNNLMCGRSVMQGWFEHWGSDGSRAVPHGSFLLYYGALWSPPDIIDSVQWQLNNVVTGDDWVIFFKLCFVDFVGSSQASAAENYARNIGYLNRVFDLVVAEKGLKVIFATALPKVAAYTTESLVWNHTMYNAWIRNFAASHAGEVFVFDMYAVLADGTGSLRENYAAGATDSHLNEQAYAALDSAFFTMLDQLDLSYRPSMKSRTLKPPLRK